MRALGLLAHLPLGVLYALSWVLYVVAYYLVGYRKKVALDNLRLAFPEKSEKELRALRKLFYKRFSEKVVEIVKAHRIKKEAILRRITLRNPEVLADRLNANQSIIGLTGHFGNWEWAVQAFSLIFPTPVDAVYKQLSSKSADKFMKGIRSRFGSEPIEMRQFGREVIRRRGQARGYGILADQSPRKDEIGAWVDFFGIPTGWYTGPLKLAEKTGFTVLFFAIYRVKRGHYEIEFSKIADAPYQMESLPPITERYVQLLEEAIRKQPEGWLWTHRRWKHSKSIGD